MQINPTLFTFSFYLLLILGIGILAYRKTKNFSDYILGGRSLGPLVTALSAGASDMSGWLLMGLPGSIFKSGLAQSWIAIGLLIGAYFNWRLVAGRLRVHTEISNNALTLPDFFLHRFGDDGKLVKTIAALAILLFFTLYCSSGMVAGAQLFTAIFHLSYFQALLLSALATITYTFIGGFLAVSWSDTIQATLMLFALILTPIMIILSLGGWDEVNAQIQLAVQTHQIAYSNIIHNISLITIISAVAWGLGYFGQPHILARFMAADSAKTMRNARRIGMTWMFLCLLGAVAIGYVGISYFQAHPDQAAGVNKNNEMIFIELIHYLFNPWVIGILLSAILAAVMSTLSAQLLMASSTLTQDFYHSYLRRSASQRELVWMSRLAVLLISFIAIGIALDENNSILGLVSRAWAGFGAAFGPLILFTLFWKKTTGKAALIGITVGGLTVIFWPVFQEQVLHGVIFGYREPLYEIIPGFIFSSISIWLCSHFGRPVSKHTKVAFDTANVLYRKEK
ncbi:sodium/proline symporter PutP [Myroides fluvii]|uniref:sodium/proline symporter PutP n=1 Tax=Myroides fluvii TaxID=2572594 RepID=UPI00131E4F59|nr:sodium/proline symporter PutP [Myroides fluvii]